MWVEAYLSSFWDPLSTVPSGCTPVVTRVPPVSALLVAAGFRGVAAGGLFHHPPGQRHQGGLQSVATLNNTVINTRVQGLCGWTFQFSGTHDQVCTYWVKQRWRISYMRRQTAKPFRVEDVPCSIPISNALASSPCSIWGCCGFLATFIDV